MLKIVLYELILIHHFIENTIIHNNSIKLFGTIAKNYFNEKNLVFVRISVSNLE